MNASIKVERFSNGSDAVVRFENGCTVHITHRHVETYAPGGEKLYRHHPASSQPVKSHYEAVIAALESATKWQPLASENKQ